jgi:pilus assembly protein CpaC
VPAANSMTTLFRLGRFAAPFFVLAMGLPAAAAPHAAPVRPAMVLPPDVSGATPIVINISPGHSTSRIVVPIDKSRIVHFDQPFSRVHVGSGDIAEVVPLSPSTIYLLGKKRGSTNLTITTANNAIVAVVDVVVTYDLDGLRQHLSDLLPTESVEIQPAGDALVLSGHVSSADHLRTISAIAERYAPGAVTNLMTLSGSQQVLLEVKFAEVQRSALVNMGLNNINAGITNTQLTGAVPFSPTSFGTIGGLLSDSKTYFLHAEIQALEQSGAVRTLAEPNIVSLSGETATFLAGGEFPIPVVQSLSGGAPTTTIEYKDFGVGLSFTPTVISSDTINLVLKSEVSALDSTFAVTTNGISVPGLKVRRATTTVELRNGQSFAIAGLIQDDFNDSLKSLPGLGSIPIIGALLRSTSYQRNQTELVVFITVHLVGPGPASNVRVPTDEVLPPTTGQILGFGRTEQTRPPPPAPVLAPGPTSLNAPTPSSPSSDRPVADSAPAAAPTSPVATTPEKPVASEAPPPDVAPAPPATPSPSSLNVPLPSPISSPEKPAPNQTASAAQPAALMPLAPSTPPPDIAPLPETATASPAPPATPAKIVAPPGPIMTAALGPIPTPIPKPSFGPTPTIHPTAAVKPVPHKTNLAVAKPATTPARPAAVMAQPLPAADEELPVTAPASIKAFRDEAANAAPSTTQPDPNGNSAP